MALVFVQDVTAPAELFAHVGYFLSECSVLALKEGGAHRDLVLLQSTRITRTLCGFVVLTTTTPIPLILQVIRDKHLASLFNHGLRFELFLTEPMPAGVKRLLSRNTRQGNIRRIRVKGRQHVVAVSDGWSREWWARGGRR